MPKAILSGLVALAIAGCSTSERPTNSANSPSTESTSVKHVAASQISNEPLSDSCVFNTLDSNKSYLLLIDAYEDVKQLAKFSGFAGEYGHIEFLHGTDVYGCRPPECSTKSFSSLERQYKGHGFELREVPDGNLDAAVRWFLQNTNNEPYSLLYRNCTDAVAGMYQAQTGEALAPANVDETYKSHPELQLLMAVLGLPKPSRETIFFPDQFTKVGRLVAKGVFGQ